MYLSSDASIADVYVSAQLLLLSLLALLKKVQMLTPAMSASRSSADSDMRGAALSSCSSSFPASFASAFVHLY